MPPNLRRLAADHAALHGNQLPPYFFMPPDDGRFPTADDLTQLNVLLTGPPGTPYSEGLWRLHLKMPEDYPRSPPKATFRTRIWHPNVEETSGAVCVDTLKRDWESKLTLRDVLITIACLLIHPNPDSALNASAGSLLREDYDAFAHQAKLMTSIHAVIPTNLQDAVKVAKTRGEEPDSSREGQTSTTHTTTSTTEQSTLQSRNSHSSFTHQQPQSTDDHNSESETSDVENSCKENNPSLSPTPVHQPPPNPRKSTLGKRPLAVLAMPYPEDPDADMMLVDSNSDPESPSTRMTPSAQNITANTRTGTSASPTRKSPKLTLSKDYNAPARFQDDLQIYEDVPDRTVNDFTRRFSTNGKENRDAGVESGLGLKDAEEKTGMQLDKFAMTSLGTNAVIMGPPAIPTPSTSSPSLQFSKASKISASGVRKSSKQRPKPKPRIGIRRL